MRWICVAHEKEIPRLGEFAGAETALHALGIGQFESLATLAVLLTKNKPDGVILAGTCGSLNPEDIGRIFLCNHFAFPLVAAEDLPEFLDRAFATKTALPAGAEFPTGTVLQNHGISLNAEKFLANTGYIPPDYPQPVLENMEAASLAWLCQKREIPFSALLCVTNTIAADARNQWKQNFVQAGGLLHAALESVMKSSSW